MRRFCFLFQMQALADAAGKDLRHGQFRFLGSLQTQAAAAAGKDKGQNKSQQKGSAVTGGKIVMHNGTSFLNKV